MRAAVLAATISAAVAAPAAAEQLKPYTAITIAGVRVLYRYEGARPWPRPTIWTFAGDAEVSMLGRDYSPVADALVSQGWLHLTLDLPGHGRDMRPEESTSLVAWRQRSLAGEDWIGTFAARVRMLLDFGIAGGFIDAHQIAIVGYSRGGFMALHTAARDERITAVAAIQPVTDLLQLAEWRILGGVPPAIADPLGVQELLPKLGTRPVWLSIGWNDTRVGTEAAKQAAQGSRAYGAGWSLLLHPERDEPHTFPATVYQEAAIWLAAQRRP